MYKPRGPEPNPQYDQMTHILNWITGCVYRKSARAQGDSALRWNDLTGLENYYIHLMEHLEGDHPSELLQKLFSGDIHLKLLSREFLAEQNVYLPSEYDYAFVTVDEGLPAILALISDRNDVKNLVAGCEHVQNVDEHGKKRTYTLEKILITEPLPYDTPGLNDVHSDFGMALKCSSTGETICAHLPRHKHVTIRNDFINKIDPRGWEPTARRRDKTHKQMAMLLHDVQGNRGRVLDYAGGTGLVPEYLMTQHPDSQLVFDVIDPSPTFTRHLREKGLRNVRQITQGQLYKNLQIRNFEADHYDALISNGAFEYGASLIDVCRLAQHVLNDSGRLFVSSRIPRGSIYDIPGHGRLYTLTDGQQLALTTGSGFGLPDGVLLDEGHLKREGVVRFSYSREVVRRTLAEHGFVITKEVQAFGYNSFELGCDPHQFSFVVAERQRD